MLFLRCNAPAALRLIVCILSLLVLPGGFAAAAPAGNATAAGKEDAFSQVWSARANDLAALAREATNLQRNAEVMAAPLAADLQAARTQMSRLSSLFQVSRGYPAEQVALLQQMRRLQERLRRGIRPLEEISGIVAIRLEEVAALQKDMDAFFKESAADGVSPLSGNEELKQYTRTLADTRTKLVNVSSRLEAILAPSRTTDKRINQILENTESSLAGSWRAYYFTALSNDLDAFSAMPTLLAEWTSSMRARLRFAYPQTGEQWLDAAKAFAGSAALMTLLGVLALRGARILARRWNQACLEVVKGSWIWIGAGCSVLSAASSSHGSVYFVFLFLGSMMVIAGIAALSWRLRMAVKPSLKNRPSPLIRLFPAAAVGVIMLFFDLPARILGITWSLAMLLFLASIVYINRKYLTKSALPLLERFAYGCAFWFGLTSLVVAVSGYARLAILLFMLLFALVNTLILGNALMALLHNLANSLFSKEKHPVRNAVAEAVSIPVSWLVSLLCTVPWMWAVPGASSLLRQALAANYTVGQASLDFSRVFFIVLLFFLFRSFVSLSRTSLNHLPDHMPHIEAGVIPPLRTMSGYALWTLFALLTLGILGVNFTSLAVVAGGLSVGIGFGLQNLFNNLLSGLLLIFERTILVGDVVEVSGASGTVRAINIRSTTIETGERALVYVPNSAIMAGQVINWTRNSRMVRRSIVVAAAHSADPVRVAELLLEAAKKQNHVRAIPAPTASFTGFGANSLEFTLDVFIDNLDYGLSTLSAIRFEIEQSFRKNGIDFPSPQFQVHMPVT